MVCVWKALRRELATVTGAFRRRLRWSWPRSGLDGWVYLGVVVLGWVWVGGRGGGGRGGGRGGEGFLTASE
jgi:hypothetical protein